MPGGVWETMPLREWLFGSNASGDGDDRPPRPDGESYHKTKTFGVYEITVEYRNGDMETFESYTDGVREGDCYRFATSSPVAGTQSFGTTIGRRSLIVEDDKEIPVGLLNRPPTATKVRHEEWELTYETTYRYGVGAVGYARHINCKKSWHERVVESSVSVGCVGSDPNA